MKKLIIIFCSALYLTSAASAQVTREMAAADPSYTAGLLRPYPGPLQTVYTDVPRGYKPFYISHFSRHGSRYHTDEETNTFPLEVLTKAHQQGQLTELGESVLERLEILYDDAQYRFNDLSPLGREQHREIAGRMYANHPGVFRKGRIVDAIATESPRVMMSMAAFCQRLRECEPGIDLRMDAAGRHQNEIALLTKEARHYASDGAYHATFDSWEKSRVTPDRLMGTLFRDPDYPVRENVDCYNLMDCLHQCASVSLDMPVDVRLWDIFTDEELYGLWEGRSAAYYMKKGPNPAAGDTIMSAAVPMLEVIIRDADKAVRDGNVAANLRFSHDAFLAPLTTVLRIDGCREEVYDYNDIAKVWSNCIVTPMAGNVQLIFYRNRAGKVIVKFLHNEKEVGIPIPTDEYPYYDWEAVRQYYVDCYPGMKLGMWE